MAIMFSYVLLTCRFVSASECYRFKDIRQPSDHESHQTAEYEQEAYGEQKKVFVKDAVTVDILY